MNPITFLPTLLMLIYIWSTLPTFLINPSSAGGTYSAVESPRRGSKHTTNITPSDTSTTNTPRHSHFAPALVRHLWDFSLTIWQHRNDDIHGATNDAAKDKQEKILDAKITAAYQQPEEHSDANRLVLFTKSLPNRLKTRYASKVKWLSLRMHLIQAPDTLADTPPPPSRVLYNMFRPLAALMGYTTTTPVP